MRWPWQKREPDWPEFFVPMATMVRIIDQLHPEWEELRIVRKKGGGVALLVDGAKLPPEDHPTGEQG